MAAEERYLEERRKNWTFYQYHRASWQCLFKQIDEELRTTATNIDLFKKWEQWYLGFSSFYEPVLDPFIQNKTGKSYENLNEEFRNFHQLMDNSDDVKYRQETEKLIRYFHNKNLLEEKDEVERWKKWLCNGWFPHLAFQQLSDDSEEEYRSMVLRLLLGGLSDLVKQIIGQESNYHQLFGNLKKLCLFASVFDVPGWLWDDLMSRVDYSRTALQQFFTQMTAHSPERAIVSMELALLEEAKGTPEELFYLELQQAIAKEDIVKVDQMSLQIRPREFIGWETELFMFAYAVGPEWVVKLVTPEENPFLISYLCNHPLFEHDLRFLHLLAEYGSVWGRMEVAKHLAQLLYDRRIRLSFRLLIYHYLRKVLERLIELNRADVLVWIFDRLLPWRRGDANINGKWMGRCMGQVLAEKASPALLNELFLKWHPGYIHDWKLDEILTEVREALIDRRDLLAEWDRGMIRLWLNRVLDNYWMKNYAWNGSFTYLENIVLISLLHRYSHKSNPLKVMNHLLYRWERIEAKWFRDSTEEKKRRDGLIAAILMGTLVLANLDKDNLGEEAEFQSVIDKLDLIINDARFWIFDRVSSVLEKPIHISEMEKALNYLKEKLNESNA